MIEYLSQYTCRCCLHEPVARGTQKVGRLIPQQTPAAVLPALLAVPKVECHSL